MPPDKIPDVVSPINRFFPVIFRHWLFALFEQAFFFFLKILVKKVYGDKKERKKARKWKLKSLEKDMVGENLQQVDRLILRLVRFSASG